MHAELKYLHSPDALNLQNYVPDDPECFQVLLQAIVGPHKGEGEESFDFLVCTPRWLEKELLDKGFVFGRHRLIVGRYDYNLLWQTISDLCTSVKGADWEAIGNKLSSFGHWEFENYSA